VIVTPGIYVDRIVLATAREKAIEHRTIRPRAAATAESGGAA
jgi:3-oxoacid CoA-transferase subunit A